MRIGFIGVGVMGRGMVANLLKRGHEVTVYTRTKAKAQVVLDAGARWADSPAQAASQAQAVITIVGYPKDVEQVYFGPQGVLEGAKPGAVLIDMTTTSPKLSQRIYQAAKAKGLAALDAPVSGGDAGARQGTLAIMVGGDREAFDRMMPVFEAMGQNIRYEGGPGCGQHAKMANQIAIAGTLAGVCEALTYARKAGLDQSLLIDTIKTGAAGSWQLTGNGTKMVAGDYAPGFYIKHFIKDMKLAGEEGADRGLELPVLQTVLAMFQQLDQAGYGDEGTQALIRKYMD